MWRLGLLIALFVPLAGETKADANSDAMKAAKLWGGPFAANCTLPASIYNWYATATELAGATSVTWFGGPEHPNNVYVVKQARAIDGERLQIVSEMQRDHAVSEAIYIFRADHTEFRAMSIHVKRGNVDDTVADNGMFIKSRQPTPWYVRCK